ncbi:DUF3306 domain-containing protein [Litoreibacter janthinus]|uniref:DUF3306 domain-containing protein n=1 Tax=Litoreibacter janthinus TaxID=670154 RepID=A0A1I6IBX4_9RHOB|nr:DUF3306 domain-containing protein [Litoreibacter janthinus]SFR64242.1 Protein of unknown function [Litoreibacter janthinus]
MTQERSFWARRLAGVKQEAEAEAEAAIVAETAQDQEDAPQTDAEILEMLDLPDPDSLQAGDDFAAFMVKAVPQHLRNRALRKLWRSNPVLACVDGLNDYDDDYLTGSTGNGPIKTTYQVGKGLLAHVEEMARQKALADAADDDEAVPEDATKVVVAEDAPEGEADTAREVEAPFELAEAETEETAPAPRRMQFHFEGDVA